MEQPPHRVLKKLQVAKQIASVLDAYVETSWVRPTHYSLMSLHFQTTF